MAVTLIGSTDSSGIGVIDEVQFARIGSLGNDAVVVADGDALKPTLGAGTRAVNVAAGWVRCCNGLGMFTAATTVTLVANGGASARRDWVVAEFNWTNAATALGTPANKVEIVVKQGPASGLDPARTQTPGDVWQVPLAVGVVPVGSSTVTLTDVRPQRRLMRVYRDAPVAGQSVGSGQVNPQNIAAIDVPDPGWPYRLRINAVEKFGPVSAGYGRIDVTLDGDSVVEGRAPVGNPGTASLYQISAPRTGPATVRLRMVAQQMTETLTTTSPYALFTVEVEPV